MGSGVRIPPRSPPARPDRRFPSDPTCRRRRPAHGRAGVWPPPGPFPFAACGTFAAGARRAMPWYEAPTYVSITNIGGGVFPMTGNPRNGARQVMRRLVTLGVTAAVVGAAAAGAGAGVAGRCACGIAAGRAGHRRAAPGGRGYARAHRRGALGGAGAAHGGRGRDAQADAGRGRGAGAAAGPRPCAGRAADGGATGRRDGRLAGRGDRGASGAGAPRRGPAHRSGRHRRHADPAAGCGAGRGGGRPTSAPISASRCASCRSTSAHPARCRRCSMRRRGRRWGWWWRRRDTARSGRSSNATLRTSLR